MVNKTLYTDEMSDTSDDFESIYEANAPLIYRFMFWRTKDQMLAEDLTSNVFEKAWRSRQSFKGGSARAWLHKIAFNTLVDYWRKRQEILTEPALLEATNNDPTMEETLDREMVLAKLKAAVSMLPNDMRQVVESRFVKGLSARKVAEELGMSEANVRVIQYRALCKLREYMKNDE